MTCDGRCYACTFKNVRIITEVAQEENTQPIEEAVNTETPIVVEQTGLVLSSRETEQYEDIGSYELTKNIFGKPIVKRIRNGTK